MSTPSIERVRTPCRAWTVILAAALAATTGCAVDALSSDVLSIAPSEDGAVPFWPPVVGERYPDLELLDQTGRRMRLSELSGRPILLEPVGMSCPACQAFSGAHRDGVGPFGDVRPQQGLGS
ncbi:MAG: hypothetical protein OEQ13_10100, partial [Acidobacteriota bacterium]|nr:hypothetical protein [Acidobacteriota bacterium]